MTAASARYGAAMHAIPSARVRQGGRDGAGTAAHVAGRARLHASPVHPLTPQ